MGSQKSLLRSLRVSRSGKRHSCRSNQQHELPKDVVMLVVKDDRDNHYCADCAAKFIATARQKLNELEAALAAG